MSADDTLITQTLTKLSGEVADATTVDDVFAAVARAANDVVGCQLLTILTLDVDTLEVQRLYSSNPSAYPPGGKKPMRNTAWGRQVLELGQPFIGVDAAAIRENFADHELIISLGLEAIVNLPVRWQGQVLGTINLLNTAGYYDASSVARGALLTPYLTAPLLQLRDHDG